MRKELTVGIVVLILACTVGALAQSERGQLGRSTPPQIDFSKVQELIEKKMADQSVPSFAIAVAKDGKIIWEQGFGWADREHHIPATAHTPYLVASITKPITATAVMILAERGKIDLDHPVNDYLGAAKLRGLAANAKQATVWRVLSQSSGLPTHYQYFFTDEPERPPKLGETIRRYGNIVFPPGERFVYSNLGYGILGRVIERVSAQSYSDFLQTEVFLPLGMHESSVWVRPDLAGQTAIPYGQNGEVIPSYVFDTPGSGAVYSSVHDLTLFAMLQLGTLMPEQRRILSERSVNEMQRPLIDTDVPPLKYGMGWFVNEDLFGYRCIFHGGGAPGAETIIRLIPSEHIVAVAVSNANGGLPAVAVHEILSVLLPQYAARRKVARDPPATRALPFEPGRSLVGEWRGRVYTYERNLPITLFFKRDGEVQVRLDTQAKTQLNDVAFLNDHLTGHMSGDIRTGDADRAGRASYQLTLDLDLRGKALKGAIMTEPTEGSVKRTGSSLSHWTELSKVREQ
jgi:CubicO group peptidase (beta-lactamase class C family)